MNPQYGPLKLMIAGAVAATTFAVAGPPASAQTSQPTAAASDAEASAVPSTSEGAAITSTWSTTRRSRAEATPRMISEAIQRSKARTQRLRASGTPERFGSEEPFTFDPAK
jgi:hypothetical protein